MKAICPYCKKRIDFTAKRCPHCTSILEGEPVWEKEKQSTVKYFWIAAIIVGLIWYFMSGTGNRPTQKVDTPSSQPQPAKVVDHPIDDAKASKGKAIYQRIKTKYSEIGNPHVFGALTDSAKLTVWIPESEWGRMTHDDKVCLTWFVQSMISDARRNPSSYIELPSHLPSYKTALSKASNLCGECWGIGVGRITPNGKGIYVDKIVVQGDSVWNSDDSRFRGLKGSEFRNRP
jgi:hypothetical protein